MAKVLGFGVVCFSVWGFRVPCFRALAFGVEGFGQRVLLKLAEVLHQCLRLFSCTRGA